MAMRQPVLILVLVSCLVAVHGDSYGNPSPSPPPSSPPKLGPSAPPPSRVAGKTFESQVFTCNDNKTSCFGKTIVCPSQCPEMKPADPKAKACFIDCNSPKCEAICRNRRPNCEGTGAACYDPRFVGGDGIMFYFHGKKGHHFSLVSDPNLQINARFIGRRPQGRTRDNTWIQSLGIMFGEHTFTLGASKTAKWDDDADHLFFSFDSRPLSLPEGHRAEWSAPDSLLTVERTSTVNSVSVSLPGIMEISVSIVPITEEDNRVHNYQIPEDDCFAHLEIQFSFFNLSPRVEGVLGQTYRPDFQNPVKRGVAMPIMGGEDKYKTSSLLSSDCKRCIFSPSSMDGDVLVMKPTTMDCTSRMGNGNGIVCRR
ncbi:hypothetical protein AMTRI_Chr09g12280 [Amborella trichopoda]